jgi:hypothetical protein
MNTMRTTLAVVAAAVSFAAPAAAQPGETQATPNEIRQAIRGARADVQQARGNRCYGSRDWRRPVRRIPTLNLNRNLTWVQGRVAVWRERPSRCPRDVGRKLARRQGWTGAEWRDLRELWQHESGWNPTALNPRSGACGIPQSISCPYPLGRKRWIVVRQVRWGLAYIDGRYTAPSRALNHFYSHRWY